MTDYSNILPTDEHEAQKMLSSCMGGPSYTPYDRARIIIEEGGKVSLSVKTFYGGDGTPMDVWHSLTLEFDLPGNTDAEWLREQLTGGNIANLIDRIITGHSVMWDGNNNVGRLTTEAQDSCERLSYLLETAPLSDLTVTTAQEWLWDGATATDVAKSIKDETPESLLAFAESDSIVIRDGIEGMREAVEDILAKAQEESEE
jgi:hypothetical protein